MVIQRNFSSAAVTPNSPIVERSPLPSPLEAIGSLAGGLAEVQLQKKRAEFNSWMSNQHGDVVNKLYAAKRELDQQNILSESEYEEAFEEAFDEIVGAKDERVRERFASSFTAAKQQLLYQGLKNVTNQRRAVVEQDYREQSDSIISQALLADEGDIPFHVNQLESITRGYVQSGDIDATAAREFLNSSVSSVYRQRVETIIRDSSSSELDALEEDIRGGERFSLNSKDLDWALDTVQYQKDVKLREEKAQQRNAFLNTIYPQIMDEENPARLNDLMSRINSAAAGKEPLIDAGTANTLRRSIHGKLQEIRIAELKAQQLEAFLLNGYINPETKEARDLAEFAFNRNNIEMLKEIANEPNEENHDAIRQKYVDRQANMVATIGVIPQGMEDNWASVLANPNATDQEIIAAADAFRNIQIRAPEAAARIENDYIEYIREINDIAKTHSIEEAVQQVQLARLKYIDPRERKDIRAQLEEGDFKNELNDALQEYTGGSTEFIAKLRPRIIKRFELGLENVGNDPAIPIQKVFERLQQSPHGISLSQVTTGEPVLVEYPPEKFLRADAGVLRDILFEDLEALGLDKDLEKEPRLKSRRPAAPFGGFILTGEEETAGFPPERSATEFILEAYGSTPTNGGWLLKKVLADGSTEYIRDEKGKIYTFNPEKERIKELTNKKESELEKIREEEERQAKKVREIRSDTIQGALQASQL